MLTFDVSGSMAATDLPPTRMDAAQAAAGPSSSASRRRRHRGRRVQRFRDRRPAADQRPDDGPGGDRPPDARTRDLARPRHRCVARPPSRRRWRIRRADYYSNRSPDPTPVRRRSRRAPTRPRSSSCSPMARTTSGPTRWCRPRPPQTGAADLHHRRRQPRRRHARPRRLQGPHPARRGDPPADRRPDRGHLLRAPTTPRRSMPSTASWHAAGRRPARAARDDRAAAPVPGLALLRDRRRVTVARLAGPAAVTLPLARPAVAPARRAAADRRLRLEPASAPAAGGPLLEPVAHPGGQPGSGAPRAGTSRSRCSPPASPPSRLRSAARRRAQRARQPDDDRPGHGRVREHVLERHRPDRVSRRPRRPPTRSSTRQGSGHADRDRRVQRLRPGRPATDQRPGRAPGRRAPEPDHRPPDGDRQRDPGRHRRHRRGRPERRSASTGEGRPGVEPPPVASGAYVPDIIVLLTDGANNAGPDPLEAAAQAADRGRARLHDRLRDGGGRPARDRTARQQFIGSEPAGAAVRRGRRVRRVRWRAGRRWVPPRHRRGHAAPGRRRDRRQLLPGRERRRARRRVHGPADHLITKHEPVEVSAGFVALGALLAALALLLGRAWRPLP